MFLNVHYSQSTGFLFTRENSKTSLNLRGNLEFIDYDCVYETCIVNENAKFVNIYISDYGLKINVCKNYESFIKVCKNYWGSTTLQINKKFNYTDVSIGGDEYFRYFANVEVISID